MLIGLIADTHVPEAGEELWPEVYERLAGVDLLMHGGDIHDLPLIDKLEKLAPASSPERIILRATIRLRLTCRPL